MNLEINGRIQSPNTNNIIDPITNEKVSGELRFRLMSSYYVYDEANKRYRYPRGIAIMPSFSKVIGGRPENWHYYTGKTKKGNSDAVYTPNKLLFNSGLITVDTNVNPSLAMFLLNSPERGTIYELFDKKIEAQKVRRYLAEKAEASAMINLPEHRRYITPAALSNVARVFGISPKADDATIRNSLSLHAEENPVEFMSKVNSPRLPLYKLIDDGIENGVLTYDTLRTSWYVIDGGDQSKQPIISINRYDDKVEKLVDALVADGQLLKELQKIIKGTTVEA